MVSHQEQMREIFVLTLNILTLKRLYSYNISIFMYTFSKNMLPKLFEKISVMLQLYMNMMQDQTV